MAVSEAEREAQANVSRETLITWLTSKVNSAQGATASWVDQMGNYFTRACEEGMNAHWAKVIAQTAVSLSEAAQKEQELRNLLREIEG